MQQRLWFRSDQRSIGWSWSGRYLTPWLLTAFLFGATVSALTAQSLPQYSSAQRERIESLRQSFQNTRNENYARAVRIAKLLGQPLSAAGKGRVIELQGVDEAGNLIYVGSTSTTRAGNTTRTSSLYTGGSLGLSLSGSSASVQNRLGLWEVQGLPRATHVELAGRINQIDVGGTTSLDGLLHSTHVAGIMIAQGVNPLVRGMAYGAKIQSYNQTNDISEQTAASSNLLLSNHSYGTISGWYYNDSRTTTVKWEWRGDTTLSATDDYKYGQYSSDAQSWDKIAVAAPNYLIVAAAANDHLQDRPADGDQYYLVNNGNALSRAVRNYQTGYDQIPTRSNAKNILTVAAVGSISNGYNVPADVQLAYFSSWGPSDDGRIKPDISGVGLNVLSSVADTDTSYAIEQGTSMASPNVTGSLLLLQEYYAQLNPGKFLRSSTLRGLVLHTAEEAGDAPGPDYRFGWGLLNTEKAARVIGNTDKTNVLSELSLAQGATYSLSVVASGKGPLVATICWTDPEGAVVTPTRDNVNDRTPKLVNDLDIRVTDGKTVSLPWVLDPANPATAATRGDNIRDNIEQILIANAVPGQSYTITVNHKGTLRNSNQDYALIVSGAGGAAYCASAPTSTADTKISRVQFGSINQVGADGCTAYNDFTKTTTTVQAGQVIPITVSLGSCGAAKNAVVKVYIDYNQNGTLDDAGETVAMSGILANSAQYSTTIAIPTTVQNTQVLRMRIVAVETSDAGTVNPCGSYGNGETQDYVLNVVQTSNDVGAASLVTPQTTFCGQSSAETAVSVRVRNYGASSQTNVPVTVQILNSSSVVVTTLTGTVPSLAAFGDALITLKIPTSVSLVPSQTYRFAISTSLSSDQNGGNNAVIETRTTAALPGPGIFSALTCGQSTGVSLRNTGDGVASWYDVPTGGNLLAVGNAAVTSVLPASNVYYVAQNDFSGRFGPATKGELGSGSYGGGYTTQPLLSAKVPLVLATARLYIGTPGRLTFSIRRLDETVVSTVTLDVKTTRTLPTSATSTNGLLDDPNDPGAEYPLNLTIPAAGEYKLAIAYEDGVSIFRNTTAIAGSTITTSTFPVSLSNILTSKGSLFANTTTNKTDTIAYAWYYLYNIQVRPLGCSNGQRVPVTVSTGTPPTATVTASGSTTICQGSTVTLRASTGTGYSYQWYRDSQPISGATSSTIAAATSGNYVVQIANSCLPVSSSAIPVSVRSNQTPVITANGFVLTSTATTNIQWLLNGVAIAGATGTSYTVVQSGRYSVKGSVSGCGDAISDEVFLTILATEPDPQDNSLTVYPIPATHQVTVVVAATASNVPSLRLTDLRGITVRSATLQRDGKNYSAVMDVSDLPGGTFFVVVTDERTQTTRVKRIRKQ